VGLGAGNTDWIITGNSFYQTTALAAAGSGIVINTLHRQQFRRDGQLIGGSAPKPAARLDDRAPRQTSSRASSSTSAPHAKQSSRHTISNFVWSSSKHCEHTAWSMDRHLRAVGTVNVGTETGNSIGQRHWHGSVL